MAKPLIPVEAIYERALALLDAEGTSALTTRRLAGELKISTRTLYQQVGSRDEMIRALVARHFSALRLEFHEYADWETTALNWCLRLRDALRAHPHLTELMTIDDRTAVMDYVDELIGATLREGIPRRLSLECCRALVNLTINYSVMEVRGDREPRLTRDTLAETRRVQKNFPMTVRWILSGVRTEAASEVTKATSKRPRRRAVGDGSI
jgi:AcrR family transcriptional regulator